VSPRTSAASTSSSQARRQDAPAEEFDDDIPF
jgi:hypothetical protein